MHSFAGSVPSLTAETIYSDTGTQDMIALEEGAISASREDTPGHPSGTSSSS
jgi:hypothetical protein